MAAGEGRILAGVLSLTRRVREGHDHGGDGRPGRRLGGRRRGCRRRRGRGFRERSVRGGGRVRHRAVAVLHSHAEHRRGDGDAVRARRHRPGPRQRGHHDPGIHGRHGRGHHVRGVFGGVHAVSRGVNGGGWIE